MAGGTTSKEARPVLDLRALEHQVHDRVNRLRLRHGLPRLAWSPALSDVARAHSRDMARQGYFSHTGRDGTDATTRAHRMDVSCRAGTVLRDPSLERADPIGENLFATSPYVSYRNVKHYEGDELVHVERVYDWKSGEAVVRQTIDEWLDSDGHRANLLHRGYQAQGIGIYQAEDGMLYVTENFC